MLVEGHNMSVTQDEWILDLMYSKKPIVNNTPLYTQNCTKRVDLLLSVLVTKQLNK